MKNTKLGALAAVAAVTLSLASCTTGSNEITTNVDSLSYADGMLTAGQYAQQLKADPKMDIAAFIKGVEESVSADTTEYSFRIGQYIGTTLNMTLQQKEKASGLAENKAIFMEAFKAILNEDSTMFTQAEADVIFTDVMQRGAQEVQKAEEAKLQEAPEAVENKAKSEAYLAEVEKEDGVTKTITGLLYKVIKNGKGATAKPQDNIVINYRGLLMDGTEFDKGSDVPAKANQFIQGFNEALKLMSKGSKLKVYIPAELAYGVRGVPGKIGANEAIVFEVELVDIK